MSAVVEEPQAAKNAAGFALWWPLLSPPMSWLVAQMYGYAVAPWACQHSVRWPMYPTGAIPLVVSLAAAWISWERFRANEADEHERRPGRERLMIVGGLALGLLSALVALAAFIPIALLDPCMRSS
jgi:hypothetical protein